MANALYAKAKANFLNGNIDMTTNNIKCVLADTADYTADVTSTGDEFLSDVTAAGRVATSGNFTTKSTTGGVFDADDVTLSSVSGDQSEAIVIYEDDAGASTTLYLIAYIDTATGLPVTPNGGDITIAWDSGANKIFAL